MPNRGHSSWDSFHPIGDNTPNTPVPLSSYVWIIVGAAFAGALILGLGYFGFEFWRYNEVRRYHDPVWEMAHKAALESQMTIDDVKLRAKMSALVGALAGLVAGIGFSLMCIAAEKRELIEAARKDHAKGAMSEINEEHL